MIFVGITDFNGQRYVAEVSSTAPATAASLERPRSANDALAIVRDKIVRSEPIDCTIVHRNNRAEATVVFMGPVRLDVAREQEG